MKKCPSCGSPKMRSYKHGDVNCFECMSCDYDSCEEVEDYPEERTSQKAKGSFSPYKSRISKK